jgi:hypothetical protein
MEDAKTMDAAEREDFVLSSLVSWVQQMGPAYKTENRTKCFARLRRMCALNLQQWIRMVWILMKRWRKAYRDWDRITLRPTR